MNFVDRFYSKVDMSGPTSELRSELGPCHLWTAATTKDGYAMFSLGDYSNCAHIVIYELATRTKIPKGIVIDHLCLVRPCVNFFHLEATTQSKNVYRVNYPGDPEYADTHCKQGHDLTNSINVYTCADVSSPTGFRTRCKICKRETNLRDKARKKLR